MICFLLLILKYTGVITPDNEIMEILVYHGIALGFIAMSLRVPEPNRNKAEKLTGVKSGALIVSTYMVQGVAGLMSRRARIGRRLAASPLGMDTDSTVCDFHRFLASEDTKCIKITHGGIEIRREGKV